jgi:hypothetical protein
LVVDHSPQQRNRFQRRNRCAVLKGIAFVKSSNPFQDQPRPPPKCKRRRLSGIRSLGGVGISVAGYQIPSKGHLPKARIQVLFLRANDWVFAPAVWILQRRAKNESNQEPAALECRMGMSFRSVITHPNSHI